MSKARNLSSVVDALGAAQVGYTPSGTGAVETTVSADLDNQFINAQRFGFVADSVGAAAANVAAWAVACAYVTSVRGTLYFPKGTYYFNATITLDVSTIRIYGENATFKWTAASGAFAFHITSSYTSSYGTSILAANTINTIEGIVFDCSSLTGKINVYIAATADGDAGVNFRRCVFLVGLTGTCVYYGAHSYLCHFIGCYFARFGSQSEVNTIGITVTNSVNSGENLKIVDCTFDSLETGLQIENGFVTMTNCTIDYCSGSAVSMTGAGMVFATNCNFETTTTRRWFEINGNYCKLFLVNCRLDITALTWPSSDHIIECYGSAVTRVTICGLHISYNGTWFAAYTPGYLIGAVAGTPGTAEAYGVTYEYSVTPLPVITPAQLVGPNKIRSETGMSVGGATPQAGGLAFPATQVAVTDANTLDDYDEYTAASTACTGAITVAVVWKLTKIGNVVTLTLPNVYQTSPTAAASFVFGVAIPAKYRPSSAKYWLTSVEDNGAILAVPGSIAINSGTGSITIYKNCTQTGNWTAAGLGGLDGTSVSWTI